MEDRLVQHSPIRFAPRPPEPPVAPPAPPAAPPETAWLGEMTIAVAFKAIQDARMALALAFRRKAGLEDLPRLVRAGMAAWETMLLGLMDDAAAHPALTDLAVRAWLDGRAIFEAQIAAMARTMIAE